MAQSFSYEAQIQRLAPAPRILTRLLPLLKQEKSEAQDIADVIKYDPTITVRVLRHCNNACSGLEDPIESLNDAVRRLGFSKIYQLVAVAVGESALGDKQQGYGMEAGDLWRHSAAVAIAGGALARTIGLDEDSAFTCGLLHDIGKLVLSLPITKDYPLIEAEITNRGKSFLEAEKMVFGVDHAELGGKALAGWNFPPKLVSGVRFHHDPAQAAPFEQTAALVHISDMIAHTLGYGDGYNAHATRARDNAFEILNIPGRDLDLLLLQTDEELRKSTWLCPNNS